MYVTHQHCAEQPVVGAGRDAIDSIVAAHDSGDLVVSGSRFAKKRV